MVQNDSGNDNQELNCSEPEMLEDPLSMVF